MKRRSFIKAATTVIAGLTVKSYAQTPLLSRISQYLGGDDKVLVIVQLIGGNDGLNMVIPLDQYSSLSAVRNNILIPQNTVLGLSNTGNATGLHPMMTGMKDLWENGKLSIVQGAGYPQFNYSHFKATDIWMTGSDSNQTLSSGWAGRYLNYEYPNYPVGFPNATVPDPLAIRVGNSVGLGLQHVGSNMGISINNTSDLVDLTGNIYQDASTADCRGDMLSHIRDVQRQSDQYGDVVENAAALGQNLSTLYPDTKLANALKIVARLVSGGLKTKIYWVDLGGFDTHDNQLAEHAVLMQNLSQSVSAFMDDVKKLNLEDRVLGMTFSEFGRRIVSNASGGTDHGSSLPMFLFGKNVVPGMVGTNPIINANTSSSTNLPMQFDYRSVYASILQDWFCVPSADLDDVLLQNFQVLPVVNPIGCTNFKTHERNTMAGETIISASPNPFVEQTTITYSSKGGPVLIQLFTGYGNIIKVLQNGVQVAGNYTINCNLSDAPAGLYYLRIQNGNNSQVHNLMKVR